MVEDGLLRICFVGQFLKGVFRIQIWFYLTSEAKNYANMDTLFATISNIQENNVTL